MAGDAAGARPAVVPRFRFVAQRWFYAGIGINRLGGRLRFGFAYVILMVGFAIWGYVDVRGRGRIQAGNIDVHRTDFTVFTEAGSAFFDGRDPYAVTNPRGWFYLYPPLFALLVSPLAILDSQSQVVVWYAVSIALGFGCYVESRRLWRLLVATDTEVRSRLGKAGERTIRIGALACLAVLLPALDCLQRGQLGIALLYPLLLGFRLVLSGRSVLVWWLGGVVLSWPAVVKLVPALPVGVLLLERWAQGLGPKGGRSTLRQAASLSLGVACGGFLFVFAIPAAFIGWEKNVHHLQTWAHKVATNPDAGQEGKFHIDSISNQSFSNGAHLLAARVRGPAVNQRAGTHWLAIDRAIAERRRADYVTRSVVLVGRATLMVVLVVVAVMIGWRGDESGQAATYGQACLASLLVSPLAWGHYYVMALPAVLFAPLWLNGRGYPNAAKALAAGLPTLTWTHYVLMPWSGPSGVLGLGATFWFLTGCIIALMVRDPNRHPGTSLPSSLRADESHELAGRDSPVSLRSAHTRFRRENHHSAG